MIVDDEVFNIFVLKELLTSFSLTHIGKALNGKECLSQLLEFTKCTCKSHKPMKYVFIDKKMPVMNGVETA